MPDVVLPFHRALALFDDEQVLAAAKAYGARWQENINAAIAGFPEDSEEEDEAKGDAILKMLNAWKAGEIPAAV